MKKDKIKYVEPADYFPKEIRKKCRIGEYAVLDNKEATSEATKKEDNEESNHS